MTPEYRRCACGREFVVDVEKPREAGRRQCDACATRTDSRRFETWLESRRAFARRYRR